MRLVACSLVLLVACNTGGDGDDYPVEPGNGVSGGIGTSGPTFPDSGMTTDGGGSITARVCGLSEILDWDECDQAGLDGLIVMLGAAQATTLMDGRFEIANPSGSNLDWRVAGGARLPSVREYPGDLLIPSITLQRYQDLAADMNVNIGNGVGTIFARVIYMGAPVEGATAQLAGLPNLIYYDDATATGSFNVDATNDRGIIWFPNAPVGANVTFTVTPPSAIGAPKDTTVTVDADAATFATVVFP